MSISSCIEEAKVWTECIDRLKNSVDRMYDVCLKSKNIMACEEAIIYLEDGIKDFSSLINTIKIEQEWDDPEHLPASSISWEIKAGTSGCSPFPLFTESDNELKPIAETEWQVVKKTKVKRKISDLAVSHGQKETSSIVQRIKIPHPKCAMELPQTKSSMAKIAHSRSLLWQERQKEMLENQTIQRRKENRKHLINSTNLFNKNFSKVPVEMQSNTKTASEENNENSSTKEKTTTSKRPEIKNNSQQNMPSDKPPAKRNLLKAETNVKNKKADAKSIPIKKEGLLGLTNSDSSSLYADKNLLDQLEGDDEWRSLRSLEESLQEEECSLKREIEEEENLSLFSEDIDDDILIGVAENSKSVQTDIYELMLSHNQEQNKCSSPLRLKKPGELIRLREKLLSPTKMNRIKQIDPEKRRQKADELRKALLEERANKLKELHKKVQEVREKQEEIACRKKEHLEVLMERILKAEKARQKGLDEIVKKAKEDENKVLDANIACTMGTMNTRLEIHNSQIREELDHRKRLDLMATERKKKADEKFAREQAAEQRRKEAEEIRHEESIRRMERRLEAEQRRSKKADEIRTKIEQRDQKIILQKAKTEQEANELKTKIQQKQEKSMELYERSLDQIKKKAGEMSASPRPYKGWTFSDFHQLPSDIPHSLAASISEVDNLTLNDDQRNDGVSLRCVKCSVMLLSDFHIMAHLLTTQHLNLLGVFDEKRHLTNPDIVANEYLKTAFDESIQEIVGVENSFFPVESTPITTENATDLQPTSDCGASISVSSSCSGPICFSTASASSKKQNKFKQKLIKIFEESIDEQKQLQIDLCSKKSSPETSHKFGKKLSELNSLLLAILKPSIGKEDTTIISTADETKCLQKIERSLQDVILTLQKTILANEMFNLGQTFFASDIPFTLLNYLIYAENRRQKQQDSLTINTSFSHPTETEKRVFLKALTTINLASSMAFLKSTKDIPLGNKETDILQFIVGKPFLILLCDLFRQKSNQVFPLPSQNHSSAETSDLSSIYFSQSISIIFLLHRICFCCMKEHYRLHLEQTVPEKAEKLFLQKFQTLFVYLVQIGDFYQFIVNYGKNLSAFAQDSPNFQWQIETIPTDKMLLLSPIELITFFITFFCHLNNAVRTFPSSNIFLTEERQNNPPVVGNKLTAQTFEIAFSQVLRYWFHQIVLRLYNLYLVQQQNSFTSPLVDLSITKGDTVDGTGIASIGVEKENNQTEEKSNKNISRSIPMSVSIEETQLLTECFLSLWNAIFETFPFFSVHQKMTVHKLDDKFIQDLFDMEQDEALQIRIMCLLQALIHQYTPTKCSSNISDNSIPKSKKGAGTDDEARKKRNDFFAKTLTACGHFAAINSKTQLLCILGCPRSLLNTLICFPLDCYIQDPLRGIIMPTLIIMVQNLPTAIQIMRSEFDIKHLITYIKEAISSLKNQQQNEPKKNNGEKRSLSSMDSSLSKFQYLSNLISPSKWEETLNFLTENSYSTFTVS